MIAAGNSTNPILPGERLFNDAKYCGVINVIPKFIAVVTNAMNRPIENLRFEKILGSIIGLETILILAIKMNKTIIPNKYSNQYIRVNAINNISTAQFSIR